jgi:hypothetical protein
MKGLEIPTDQLEKYTLSVHGQKRLRERDFAAPACTDCHGNHGAAPPGVYAVTHVCGKCHVTQAELFSASTHAAYFRDGGMPPCTTCHNHHDILATSDELLGTGPQGTCATCHQPGDHCDQATAAMKKGLEGLSSSLDRARASLARADRLGMDVERPTYDLTAGGEALVRARVVVHALSEKEVGTVIEEGVQVAGEVEKAALAKLDEYAFRRRGLAAASAMLLLFAGLLALKAANPSPARNSCAPEEGSRLAPRAGGITSFGAPLAGHSGVRPREPHPGTSLAFGFWWRFAGDDLVTSRRVAAPPRKEVAHEANGRRDIRPLGSPRRRVLQPPAQIVPRLPHPGRRPDRRPGRLRGAQVQCLSHGEGGRPACARGEPSRAGGPRRRDASGQDRWRAGGGHPGPLSPARGRIPA